MNQVPVRRRRSVVSVLLGAFAMAGSFAVMGVLVLSDVADAKAPRASEPEAVEKRPVKKKGRKRAKVDFGRFEGY